MGHGITEVSRQFIDLSILNVLFLLILGFFGGLLSGFIGSGGAFVLTPGMMSLGVPAPVAVASNMCHKFPKALVGAYKRFKYGQVDIKLGLIVAVSAIVGVEVGIRIQEIIFSSWGTAGSNLYVSSAFVTILITVGTYMLFDARSSMKSDAGDTTPGFAKKMGKFRLFPMINFRVANSTMSLWVTIPVGFATGMLAATIAVGGFIGVPAMIYVLGAPALVASATELVVAFVMGLSGTVTWALGGFVDIRMTLLILAGSLFGVQVGAIGTTYVRKYMIKFVMATIMILVSISQGVVIPTYLHDLAVLSLSEGTISMLKDASFVMMCITLTAGGVLILGNMWHRKRALARSALQAAKAADALAR